jgi:hypothetical protein
MRLVDFIEYMGKLKNAYKIFVGKPAYISNYGWKDNIKNYVKVLWINTKFLRLYSSGSEKEIVPGFL